MKQIPAHDISQVIESSASEGDSQLSQLVNGGKVDQAAQMAYSILTAVEEADVDTNNKREVCLLLSYFKFLLLESLGLLCHHSANKQFPLSSYNPRLFAGTPGSRAKQCRACPT